MLRTVSRFGIVALAGLCSSAAAEAQAPRADPPPPAQAELLRTYCVTCHNQRLQTAGLALDTLDIEDAGAAAGVWEKVVARLRSGAMPPVGRPRPDAVDRAALVSWLETSIDRAAASAPNPGRPAVHRLNRAEYVNAIRDLLAIEVDAAALLPADDSGYGFDNIGDVLSFSPALLERYISAAKKISRLAVGELTAPELVTFRALTAGAAQDQRLGDELPAGSRGGLAARHHFPAHAEYTLRVRMQRNPQGIVRGRRMANTVDFWLDGALVASLVVPARAGGLRYGDVDDSDGHLVVRVPVKAGPHLVAVTFPERSWAAEGVGPTRLPVGSSSFAAALDSSVEYGRIHMAVDSLDIEGPFEAERLEGAETPSRRRIFRCRPAGSAGELSCATEILSALARRAYRRPVTAGDVEPLLRFFERGRGAGGFDSGIQRALEAVITDPEFLFRVESAPVDLAPGAVYRVGDLDLASRLSFFLWSSIPDDELLDLAVQGRLQEPEVLHGQVRRMLDDRRSAALVHNFFGQWLSLRALQSAAPVPGIFPEFDEDLRGALRQETTLFLESQLRGDSSVWELLSADHTFVNERLARHYRIPHVYGSHFRRVTLDDRQRGGLLGHGSLLTVTSYGHRTSPVLRGQWVLNTLLGAPPPPPPPDVPALEENDAARAPRSQRERLEAHRRNAACASCHARMDPLGFALEHFDAIGRWRTTDAGRLIDAGGTLPDGTAFDSPAGFRDAFLRRHRDEFVLAVTERLLTYALGRGTEYYDMPAVRSIVRGAAPDYRWSSIIQGIVDSTPFRMSKAES